MSKKAIESAEGVAALRAASVLVADSKVRNPDYLAKSFVGNKHRLLLLLPYAILRRVVEKMVPGGYCYFLARAKFFDEILQLAIDQNTENLVILGAGYDTRAHRFKEQLNNISVYEIDLPATQSRKLSVLKKLHHFRNNNVVYIKHDFNKSPMLDALVQSGFNNKKRTLFLLEGVSYYLAKKDVIALLKLCTDAGSGSRFVIDYSDVSFVNGDISTYGSARMAKWLNKHNEPFRFGIEKGSAKQFFQDAGLQLTHHYDSDGIRNKYLVDSNGFSVGRPLGYLNFASCIKE